MITVNNKGFLKNGVPWIPIGMGSTATGIKNRGGIRKYMDCVASYGIDCVRIHIPGTVSNICDPDTLILTDECRTWIQEIGEATRANGIYMVVMPFPNELSWKYNPLCSQYKWVHDWYANGLTDSKKLLDNLQAEIANNWDVVFWEAINEVHVRNSIETDFICGVLDHLRQIQSSPVCVSFEQQDLALTPLGKQVIEHEDIVNAHTYISPINLSWVGNNEKNEWVRIEYMVKNVLAICAVLKSSSNGKPYLSSEDPLYFVWGPFVNFMRGIFNLPTNDDIAESYIDRSLAWLEGGAAMSGIMWSMAYGDYPDHILEAIKTYLNV